MEITTTRNCKNGKLLLLMMNSHRCIPRERMGAESEAAEMTVGITVLLREFRCGWSVNGRRRAPPAATFCKIYKKRCEYRRGEERRNPSRGKEMQGTRREGGIT